MLIKFSQLKSDSVKQYNILLQSDLVRSVENEEMLNTVNAISPARLPEFCHLL